MTEPSKEARDVAEYLIKKGGYWYRPKAQGYTLSAIQAGRFTLAEAESRSHPNGKNGPRDGITFIHERDVICPSLAHVRELKSELDKARAEGVAAATAWLREQDGHGEWHEAADAIDAEFLTPTKETE